MDQLQSDVCKTVNTYKRRIEGVLDDELLGHLLRLLAMDAYISGYYRAQTEAKKAMADILEKQRRIV